MSNHSCFQNRLYYLFPVMILLIVTSCVSQRKTVLFQPSQNDTVTHTLPPPNYLVQNGDVLYIRVQSTDEKATAFIYGPLDQPSDYQVGITEPYFYYNGNEINKYGYIKLPYLDSIYVQGMDLDHIAKLLTDKIKNFILDPVVSVKLANFRVSVFGEVENSGSFIFYNHRTTIFDAVALARPGAYADRKHVTITRTGPGDRVTVTRIDLTKTDIINSEYYYLRPNDQIYFETLRSKFWVPEKFPYGVLFSVISTILSLYGIFR